MKYIVPEKLYGVIGWPLAQTLSPLLHNTGFQALGIPAAYFAWPLPPDRLEAFLESLRLLGMGGCSVTIPHKVAVLPLLDNISEAAVLAGAANTLYWRDGALCGENTDVAGFLAPLAGLDLSGMDALLLGAGGAARAVAAGLRLRGIKKARVATPGDRRQIQLAERFGFEPILWKDRYRHPAGLLINATPLGMRGDLAGETPYDFSRAPEAAPGLAYDLVYNPLETPFLKGARVAGFETVSGLEMFYGQGGEQFRIWTGRPLPPEARMKLERALKGEPA